MVTKLLISPVKKRIFCPKTTKFGPKLAFLVNLGQAMQAYSVPCWLVGWWLWRAGCISQDTYLLYIISHERIHPQPFFPFLKHYMSLCLCLRGATIPTVFGSPAGLHYVLSHRPAGEPFLPASTIILQLRPSQTCPPLNLAAYLLTTVLPPRAMWFPHWL